MAELVISRWTVTKGDAYDANPAPCRQEFVANVFEALSWFYEQ